MQNYSKEVLIALKYCVMVCVVSSPFKYISNVIVSYEPMYKYLRIATNYSFVHRYMNLRAKSQKNI